MPEVQRTSQLAGEMTQRFIEFVMMQAQQASLFLGRIPHPKTGKQEVNLDGARFFIDQLEMVQEKTRGNLTKEEEQILSSMLADLRMAFVQATQSAVPAPATPEPEAAMASPEPANASSEPQSVDESESKKKFSKSYGA